MDQGVNEESREGVTPGGARAGMGLGAPPIGQLPSFPRGGGAAGLRGPPPAFSGWIHLLDGA